METRRNCELKAAGKLDLIYSFKGNEKKSPQQRKNYLSLFFQNEEVEKRNGASPIKKTKKIDKSFNSAIEIRPVLIFFNNARSFFLGRSYPPFSAPFSQAGPQESHLFRIVVRGAKLVICLSSLLWICIRGQRSRLK